MIASTMNTQPQLLLKPHDAAAALGISERTLWGLTIRDKNPDGEIPCVRIGRAVRYSVAALQAFIQRREAQSGNPAPQGAQ